MLKGNLKGDTKCKLNKKATYFLMDENRSRVNTTKSVCNEYVNTYLLNGFPLRMCVCVCRVLYLDVGKVKPLVI